MRLWISIGIFVAMSVLLVVTLVRWLSVDEVELETTEELQSELPDFASYTDTRQKKTDFFEFLLPKIRASNDEQTERRRFVASLDPMVLSTDQQAELYALAKRYRVSPTNLSAEQLIEELLIKVDVVPASLVLAQSANESAWGTSRFAIEGNNLFGIWCFSKGCGITPRSRSEGAIHEVEKFTSVQAGVDKYVSTINSHPAYTELRAIRSKMREKNLPLRGVDLARGLSNYSERGQAYIDEIQEMIEFNKLEAYNRHQSKK